MATFNILTDDSDAADRLRPYDDAERGAADLLIFLYTECASGAVRRAMAKIARFLQDDRPTEEIAHWLIEAFRRAAEAEIGPEE